MPPRRALALVAILTLAAGLRLHALDAGWFGVDQARDLAWGEAIARGVAFPTVGPAMRNRVYLAATYYYFWSLPEIVSRDPLAAYAFAGLLGVLAVWLAHRLAAEQAGQAAGLVAALVLATSPVAVIDARVAWAPAALPVATGLVLLGARRVLRAPSARAAAGVLVAACLAVQLHLAAAPIAAVAVVAVGLRARALRGRGLALAALSGSVAFMPAVYALSVPLAASSSGAAAATTDGRMAAILALASRVVDGLSIPSHARPLVIDAWILAERAAVPLALCALAGLLLRGGQDRRDAARWVVPAAGFAATAAVALLPAEAWYYYLDTLLVPSAVAAGAVVGPRSGRRAVVAVLLAVVALRIAGLAWWEGANAATGEIPTNLDLLRLSAPPPDATGARARVLTVATRRRAADLLLGDLAIPLDAVWRRAHGVGFADLDTDNGFFFARAAREARPAAEGGTRPDGRSTRTDALLVYPGDFPPAWTAAFPAPLAAGPLLVYGYYPAVDSDLAVLANCGGGPAPRQDQRHPLDYGSGERELPRWPCSAPVVSVPVREVPAGSELRVFARATGAARVVGIDAAGGAEPAPSSAAGVGLGVRILAAPTSVTVRLEVDGPAALDVYELHGAGASGAFAR